MSLTNAPSTSNVSENWIAQLFHQNSYLSFDGTDDYIDLGETTSSSPIAIGSSTGITIAFWINFPTLGAAEPIFRSHDHATNYVGYAVDKNSSNQISFSWYDGSGSGPGDRRTMTGDTALSADTWYFVIITSTFAYATSGTKIYINGTTSDSITASGTYSGTYPVYSGSSLNGIIGQKLPSTDIWGEFKLRNLGIWAAVLDSANLTVIYNSGNFLSFLQDNGNYDESSALKGYWEFNNGDNIIQDKSGNGAHGTITGGVYEDFLPIALSDTTVDDVFYHGTITNVPSIRSSIDLAKSTSDTDNISLSIANFQTDGTDFYKLIFNGTNNYHNKGVRIYAQFSGETTLSNCQRIFTGRLVDITLDQNQNIKMQINSHRPWDKIEFPQTKSLNSVYQPVVYGDYSAHADRGLVRDFANAVHPVPFHSKGLTTDHLIIPAKDYTNIYPHYYDATADAFLPIKSDNYTAATQNLDDDYDPNVNIGLVKREMRRRFLINPISLSTDGSTTFTNAKNLLMKSYNSSGMTFSYTDSNAGVTKNAYVNFACELNKVLDCDLDLKGYAATPASQTNVFFDLKIAHGNTEGTYYDSGASIVNGLPQNQQTDLGVDSVNGADFGATSVVDSSYAGQGLITAGSDFANDNNLRTMNLWCQIAGYASNVVTCELVINDMVLYVDSQQSYDEDKGNTNNSISIASNLKYLYLGVDGLTASWDSGAISHGHDAHRDMLIRFAGVSTEDPEVNTGEAWSVLNTDRAIDNWKVRYWQLEPRSLKDALDKMAYESGFISKFSPSNQLKYIYVKKSSELSALLNLTKDDIANVSVSTTGIDNVHATMDISNKLHPADSTRYYSTTTATDASLITKYNLGDKEGIASVNLDMNVGTIPTTANADCNADWYSYMHNIIGDMKIIVDCQVVNPAKGYQLETGDIVTFTDMPVEMFGTDFSTSTKFMIIETKRSPGKVGITAREVG